MKILVVAHHKNLVGGANKSLLMVLNRLKNFYNVECDVILPGEGTMSQALKNININCIISEYKNPFSVCKGDVKDVFRKIAVHLKYFKEINLAKKLAEKLSNNHYDLVYTNTRFPIIGATIAKILNIPHVCHIREFGSDDTYQGLWNYKKIYKSSDKIILISEALFNKMAEYTPKDKLVMIHNGISGGIGIETHQLFENNRFNMILTARIIVDKGHKDAVLAVKKMLEDGYDNIHLYFAGSSIKADDSYERYLKKIIEENKLDNYVTFLGEVSDMGKIRKDMDIELMCAVCETFGRVTVEGMRNGLLVVGSNTGGTLEIIEDGVNGLLYKQGDPNSLAEVLENIYKNNNLGKKIANNGYNMSQTNFTEEKNVEQIYNVMSTLVEKFT